MTIKQLADFVSKETGLEIRTQSRKNKYVIARAIFYDIAYNEKAMGSLEQIGKEVDRDHASVLYSLRTIVPQMERYFKEGYAMSLKIKDKLNLVKDSPYNEVIEMLKNVPEGRLDQVKIFITETIDSDEGNDIQEHKGDLHTLP